MPPKRTEAMTTHVETPPGRPARADEFGRRSQGERTRKRIVDAAVELFATNGFRNTGLSTLAERVGMSGPGLLYYFGSMERLLQDVMAEREHSDHPEQHQAIRLADLRRQGDHKLANKVLTRLYVVLAAEALEPGEPLHEYFVRRNGHNRDFVRDLLAIEIAEGRARPDIDVEQLALEVTSVTLGLEMQWLADPNNVDLVAASERYIDELMHRIAPTNMRNSDADSA